VFLFFHVDEEVGMKRWIFFFWASILNLELRYILVAESIQMPEIFLLHVCVLIIFQPIKYHLRWGIFLTVMWLIVS